jgi:hypothetical protein
MRALIVAAALAIAGAAAADQVSYGLGLLPHDAPALRALDNAQLRIVRRARALCWHAGPFGFSSGSASTRACIIGETESAVANSNDAVLQAYHKQLPFHAKYNEYRPAFYWQRLVVQG